MSINGIRRPATAVPPLPDVAPGDTGSSPKGVPASATHGAQPNGLSDSPPQRVSEAATRRRISLARPGHVTGAVPDAAQAIAAKVCSEVDDGQVALRGRYSAATLRAAAGVASKGLIALGKDLSPRR